MSGPGVPVDHRRDIGVFLARVTRLDPAALVRVRPAGREHLTLWAQLPFDVLVARTVAGSWTEDVTVAAAELLDAVSAGPLVGSPDTLELPRRRDTDWRGSLPPQRGWQPLDTVPADIVRRLVAAGEQAFRAAGGGVAQAAGESLLGHETLRVRGDTAGAPEIAVPFRLLLGLARMAVLGDEPVAVSVQGPWLRLTAQHGIVYHRRSTALLMR
jgi:hypothetical protein